jgi:hypothetical protein
MVYFPFDCACKERLGGPWVITARPARAATAANGRETAQGGDGGAQRHAGSVGGRR